MAEDADWGLKQTQHLWTMVIYGTVRMLQTMDTSCFLMVNSGHKSLQHTRQCLRERRAHWLSTITDKEFYCASTHWFIQVSIIKQTNRIKDLVTKPAGPANHKALFVGGRNPKNSHI